MCLNSIKIEFYKKNRDILTHIKVLSKRQRYDQVLQKGKLNTILKNLVSSYKSNCP